MDQGKGLASSAPRPVWLACRPAEATLRSRETGFCENTPVKSRSRQLRGNTPVELGFTARSDGLGTINAPGLSEAVPPVTRTATTVSNRDDLHAGGRLPKDDHERKPTQDDAACA